MKLNAPEIKLSLLLLFAATPCARPQGTFVNLDFESANIPPGTPPGRVAASDAFPGWTAYGADVVAHETISLGVPAISTHDTNDPFWLVQGNYTVLMQASYPGGPSSPLLARSAPYQPARVR